MSHHTFAKFKTTINRFIVSFTLWFVVWIRWWLVVGLTGCWHRCWPMRMMVSHLNYPKNSFSISIILFTRQFGHFVYHSDDRWGHRRFQRRCSCYFTWFDTVLGMHIGSLPATGHLSAVYDCKYSKVISIEIDWPSNFLTPKPFRLPEHCVEYVKIIQWGKENPFDSDLDGDDPQHVSWVYEKAQERANSFNITGLSYRLVQGVLKNIIPAVASTNAVIAASCANEVRSMSSTAKRR